MSTSGLYQSFPRKLSSDLLECPRCFRFGYKCHAAKTPTKQVNRGSYSSRALQNHRALVRARKATRHETQKALYERDGSEWKNTKQPVGRASQPRLLNHSSTCLSPCLGLTRGERGLSTKAEHLDRKTRAVLPPQEKTTKTEWVQWRVCRGIWVRLLIGNGPFGGHF